jgi:hypothetical protein
LFEQSSLTVLTMGGRRRKQVDEEEEEEVELQEESEDDSDDSDDDDDEGVALMEKAEGIDDAVRRKLRRDERALNKAIQDGTVSYEEGRDQNNELFKSVGKKKNDKLVFENAVFHNRPRRSSYLIILSRRASFYSRSRTGWREPQCLGKEGREEFRESSSSKFEVNACFATQIILTQKN